MVSGREGAESLRVVEETLHSLLLWLQHHGLASYDYADILTSPLIRALTFGGHFAQRVAIQFGKRFPFNVRAMLGIPPHVSSQTLALLCSAEAWQYAAEWPGTSWDKVRDAADAVRADRLGGEAGPLWGMKLHYASRFVQASPTTPNLFQTSNAIHALLDAFQVTGIDAYAQTAEAAATACVERFGIVELERTASGAAFCRYYPGMEAPVYNVNALLAAALWRLSGLGIGRAVHAQRAESLLRFVLAGQRADGAWPYAAHPAGRWVDGYHTGYVLEALGYLRRDGADPRVEAALERGAIYFRERLIDSDGCPKYFDHARYPIDVQNCAQAIQTIARLQPTGGLDRAFLRRTVICVVEQLFLRDPTGHGGYFAATRRRWFTNRTPYVRWGLAPMVLALTFAWNAERGNPAYLPAHQRGTGTRLSPTRLAH